MFDKIAQDDLIFAFFPCIRFSAEILISLRGQLHGMEKWTNKQKMQNCMRIIAELKHFYDLVNELFIVCIDRGLRLIMENPFSEEHFLRRYWCMQPAIIDKDRRKNGDYLKKPTQYWFLNCEPKRNLVFEPLTIHEGLADGIRQMTREYADKMKAKSIKTARSTISKQYANRFIRQFII